jgi:hypothetical protein
MVPFGERYCTADNCCNFGNIHRITAHTLKLRAACSSPLF